MRSAPGAALPRGACRARHRGRARRADTAPTPAALPKRRPPARRTAASRRTASPEVTHWCSAAHSWGLAVCEMGPVGLWGDKVTSWSPAGLRYGSAMLLPTYLIFCITDVVASASTYSSKPSRPMPISNPARRMPQRFQRPTRRRRAMARPFSGEPRQSGTRPVEPVRCDTSICGRRVCPCIASGGRPSAARRGRSTSRAAAAGQPGGEARVEVPPGAPPGRPRRTGRS